MLSLWLPLTGDIHNQGLSDVKIYGAPTSWQEGKIGKCAKFNGDYKTIYTETTHEFDYTDNFSWACWVLPVYSGTSIQYIFSVGRADYGSYGYGARLASATQINIRYGNAEWGIPCEASKWVHIAFVKRNKNIRIYKNGSVYGSITYGGVTPTYTDSVGLTLGCFRYNAGSIYPSFCSVNDFRLYDTPLTDRQVKEISKGLICHYPLGEVDGKIGGRNLFKGTRNFTSGVSSVSGLIDMSNTVDSFTVLKAKCSTGRQYYDPYSLSLNMEAHTFYTLSFYAKADLGCIIHSYFYNIGSSGGYVDGNTVNTLTTSWKKYTITWKTGDTSRGASVIPMRLADTKEVWAYIYGIKFEKSNKATPWTPAPEDDASFYDNTIYDTSGYNHNANVGDSTCPTWSSDTPRYKGSYVFNGNKQYVTCGTSTMIEGQEEITINCWAYMDDWTKFNARLFSCTENGGYNTEYNGNGNWLKFGVCVFSKADKTIPIYSGNIGGYTGIKLSDMSSGWHMITCVYKASVGDTIYLDGKLYEKKTYTSYGIYFNKNSYLFLGGESSGVSCIAPYFNGKLSDFRIYATALSDSDILELYQSSASVDNSGNLSTYEIEEEL